MVVAKVAQNVLSSTGAALRVVAHLLQAVHSRPFTHLLLLSGGFIAYGQLDEQYSRMLAEKVHRGQRGRVLNGYSASGRTYGYSNVPVEHPHKKGLYGRPYVEAVRLEPNPEEAHIVLRIFNLYSGGLGSRAIAKLLNGEGVPSPLQSSSEILRSWTTNGIKLLLRNEKYRGIHIWNRTRTIYRPGMQGKMQQKRPSEQWERVEVPDWRIVPDELWDAVRQESERRKINLPQKFGGLNRTSASRHYMFSGLMRCGICQGPMNIVGMKNGRVRYGCAKYRSSGTCDNRVTIRRDLLEEDLIGAFVANLSRRGVQKYLNDEFVRQASLAWKAQARRVSATSAPNQLRVKCQQLQQQSQNVLNAIADGAGSSLLYERLRSIEAQMKTLSELTNRKPLVVQETPGTLKLTAYLRRAVRDLGPILMARPEAAKLHLSKHLEKMILVPKHDGAAEFYEIEGCGASIFSPTPRMSIPQKILRRTCPQATGR